MFKGNSAIAELLYVQGEQCNSNIVVCVYSYQQDNVDSLNI
jgi:hypothetical protein